MGLLGGGDDSSLASSSGWGVQPPPSSSDWGSSSANNNNNSSSGGGSTSLSGGNNNNNSAAGSGWASAGSCGSGAAVSAAMAINSTGSNQQTANGGLRGSQQQQQSSLNSNQANLLMSGNQSGDQQQQQSLLSSSPKPALSSSWAQAAGKGLVHATSANASGNASGPNASSTASAISSAGIITTNSHDTSNVGSGGGGLGLGAASSQQQQSSVASSCLSASSVATTANCSSGGLSMSGNVVSSTMAFGSGSGGSSSNGNGNSSSGPSAGGLNMLGGSSNVAGSSGNAMDAANAAANKRQMGSSSSTTTSGANINDLIGGLSDDFRETLFTEKWGSSVINQDSPWNLPSSSHASSSSPKVHQETSTWRCPVNSGTEIWESSIRQKKGSLGGPGGVGLLSSASVGMGVGGGPVQPWGQTPTTNIGGTWGEEEGIDTSNHWTGVPQSANSLNSVTSVGGGMAPTGGPSGLGGHSALGGHVNSSSINPNWSAGPSALSNGGPGSGISNPYSLLTPSGLGAGGLGGANNIGGGDGGGVGMNNWNGNDKSAYDSRKATNWGNFDQSDSVSESNWDKSGNDGGSFGTWNPPDNRKDGCWDKDSNDSFKGVDDGTAVWGNPGGRSGAGNSGQHGQLRQPQPPNWQKEQQQQQQQPKYGMPMPGVNKNGYSGNPGWNNGNNGGNKPLGQNMLTRTWTDASSGHRKSPSMWNDDSKSMNGSMTPNWSDGQIDTSSWGSSKPAKPLTREMILSSKQYRLLVDLGHKKDDAENALRNCGGRFEDALAHLETVKPIKSGFGVGGGIGNNPLMDFNKMTLSGAGGGNGGGNGRGHGGLAPMPPNVGGSASACPPASLHNLAQRIHLAVSTGFLNPAILNQPLSNQNLEILSELLNQIKNLKEVQGQMAQSGGSLKSSLEYRLREVRQNITQLQNQLRNDAGGKMTNNGIGKDYFEPNNDQGGHSMNKEVFQLSKGPVDNYGGGNGNAPGGHPGGGGGGLQGSRLFNWKHSKQQSAGEHGGPMGNDNFIRAPGGLPKANHSATNWSNFMDDNGGGGWPDKSGGDHMAGGGGLDCADYGGLGNFGAPMGAPDTFDSGYGKHSWKPAAKSALVDDDPRSPIAQKAMMGGDNSFSWNSGMGGGAASANAISKGSNSLLGGGGGGGGGGQGAGQMDSLNSPFGFSGNTWSYNSGPAPSSAAGNAAMGVNATPFNAADLNKNKNAMNNNSKPNNSHTWSNSGLNSGSDYSDSLWTSGGGGNNSGGNGGPAGGGAGAGKPRPPPGLSKSGSVTSGGNSIWSSGGSGSEYLRLRNLTPQIDGSTLKTLCCQHGPLNLFHLFLNHGAAIARYSNREQAIKAQSALNNCVLGNTTILADLPLESEVQQYLQLINGGGHSANPNGNGGQQSANSANGHNAHNSGGGGQQSHGGHHGGGGSGGGHHSGYGNPNTASWSNGTNASQSSAGGGAGHVQSNAAPSTAPIPLYSRTSSVGAVSAGPNSAPITVAHMSPFASGSAPVQVNQLPYNSGAPGLVSSVHSNYNSTLLSQAAGGVGVNSASQFSKMDNGLLSSWNTASSGSGGLWDSSALPGASGGLWSTGGYGAADRNTPIQNAFLPGDLLTGDNN